MRNTENADEGFFCPLLIKCGEFFVFFGVFSSCVLGAEPSEFISRWKSISSSVVTAKVDCVHLNIRAHFPDDADVSVEQAVSTSLTRDEAHALFSSIFLHQSSDRIPALADEVRSFLATKGPLRSLLSDLQITQSEGLVKNDELFPRNRSVRAVTTAGLISYEEGIQRAFIVDASGWAAALKLRDICFVPDFIPGSMSSDFAVEPVVDEPALVRLVAPGNQITVNAATAFVSQFSQFDPTDGSHIYEVLQAEPVTHEFGIVLPSASARINYRRDLQGAVRVYSSDFYLVRTVAVNAPIALADFKVSAPKGVSVEDRRLNPPATSVVRQIVLEEDVSDLSSVKFTSQVKASSDAVRDTNNQSENPQEARVSDRRGLTWLFWVNVLTVVAICAWFVIAKQFSKR